MLPFSERVRYYYYMLLLFAVVHKIAANQFFMVHLVLTVPMVMQGQLKDGILTPCLQFKSSLFLNIVYMTYTGCLNNLSPQGSC